jgi:glycosyltransferase involved in cell wall biosynthesis
MKLNHKYKDILKKEFTKDFYDINYLDKFNIPNIPLNVSVIIPTYNRAPYGLNNEKSSLNPLVWSIRSVLQQKVNVKEIVIIDDNSSDHTKEVIDWFKDNTQWHKFIYIKNKEKLGSAKSRNIGVSHSSGDYVFFIDDDYLIAPYACFGALYSFEKIKKEGLKIGALGLPIYVRKTVPERIIPQKKIGQIYFSNGVVYLAWDAFPLNYLRPARFRLLDNKMKILKPFKVSHIDGYSFCERKVYLNVGGFPETFDWPNKYGEEMEFSCRLSENGYNMYFSPDLKFQAFHGVYGLEKKIEFVGKDWLKETSNKTNSFKDIVKDCEQKRRNTGNRVDENVWFFCKIISLFVIIYKRNKNGAKNFLKRVYEEFVIENEYLPNKGVKTSIKTKGKRQTIWKKAIRKGIEFIKNQELKSLKNFKDAFLK